MDRRARSRSVSDEGQRLQDRFKKIRKEKRSGQTFKRRYRSACLKLLTYFIRVLALQTEDPDYDPYNPHSLYLSRRQRQAEDQLEWVRGGWLPRKDQPLLPRLEPVPREELVQGEDPGQSSEDSFVAETVAISDEESDSEKIGDRPVIPDLPGRLRGPSRIGASPVFLQASSKSSSSRPQAKPKLLPTSKKSPRPSHSEPASSSSVRPSVRPSAVPEPLGPSPGERVNRGRVQQLGFRISRLPTFKYSQRLIFSVDWHQVLDTVRCSRETLRTDRYHILPEVQAAFQQLKTKFKDCLIIVNSYCCSEYFRKGIASIVHPLVDHCISTIGRCGETGKFSALTELADQTCVLVHYDDSPEIVQEWKRLSVAHRNLGIFGIRVPRHWKKQREVTGVSWHQNILEAIQVTCDSYNITADP